MNYFIHKIFLYCSKENVSTQNYPSYCAFHSQTNLCGPTKLFPGPKEAQVAFPLPMATMLPGTNLNTLTLTLCLQSCHRFKPLGPFLLPIVKVGNLFSVKGQTVNILYFVCHMVSATTTQFCLCRVKAARDDRKMSDCGCISIKLYLWMLKF